jgi:hypothetical protein
MVVLHDILVEILPEEGVMAVQHNRTGELRKNHSGIAQEGIRAV